MKIKMKRITIGEIVKKYQNNNEDGVLGYGGNLNIRPAYQREFVYKDKQRDAVIETVMKNFPLNVMYWIKNGENDFEVLDGQQRTISICEYFTNQFSVGFKSFGTLDEDTKKRFLNYELMVYICEGNEKDKLDWFKTINIAGEKLSPQELRNAVYTGPWLADAKRHFSRGNCAAYNIGKNYLNGSPIRQDYLETAISWINEGNVEDYMDKNRIKPNANELWLYYQAVIGWTKLIFPNYRKEMKGINWGSLYNEFKDKEFDTDQLEKDVIRLMQDEDVTKKPGIYSFLLTGEERFLSIRAFNDKQKREAFEEQKGVCVKCTNTFTFEEMAGDHILAWSSGGKTIKENLQMLCKKCNGTKSSK